MFRAACCVLCWLVLLTTAGHAAERVALVIGNGAYESGTLRNPRHDAEDVAQLLESLPGALRFEVVRGTDLRREEMIRKVQQFRDGLEPGGIGLVFFAGHAVEHRGRNFLLPVDNGRVHSMADAELYGLDAQYLISQMESAGTQLNLLILDACRDNPFGTGQRSLARGLAPVDAQRGTLVAFAAGEGKLAAEGEGRNSPYTAALLKFLTAPGLELSQVFNRVGSEVARATAGAQVPWYSSSPIPPILLGGEATRVNQTEDEARSAELWIRVSPLTADVFVNAGFVGKGIQTLTGLDPATEYRIEARLAGYRPATTTERVYPGRPTEVLLELQPLAVPRPVSVPAPDPGPKSFQDPLNSGGLAPRMLVIPAGEIEVADIMGDARTIGVSAFALAATEVRFADYQICIDAGVCPQPRVAVALREATLPVIQASWDDANVYARWLSEETGRHYRLPTEAEWQYAAMGGSRTAYWWGGDLQSGKANCKGCGGPLARGKPVPVGSFAANPLGLHDTAGNVWEWVEDCFRDIAPMQPSAPVEQCAQRTLRGGGWDSSPQTLHAAAPNSSLRSLVRKDRKPSAPGTASRRPMAPQARGNSIGFRLAADL